MSAITSPAGITLEYDTFGSSSDPAVLLVMGFTAQMTGWYDAYCQRIADAGRFVIRFDNRDCGLSTKFDGQIPDMSIVLPAMTSPSVEAAAKVRAIALYTLSDMSDDAFSVLDGLGIQQAHIVGASMGGFIVQTMAIEHPERVLSLTSIMSTTGEPEFGTSTPEAQAALLTPKPTDRDGYIEESKSNLVFMSKKYADLDKVRERAALAYDRSFYPEGAYRQMAAIIASGPRNEGLAKLTVAALVIHGLDDTLIQPSGGERTAELIPDSRLVLVEDMGHDQPEPLWPLICGEIIKHTA